MFFNTDFFLFTGIITSRSFWLFMFASLDVTLCYQPHPFPQLHAFDSRAPKRTTKPQIVYDEALCVFSCFKLDSCVLFTSKCTNVSIDNPSTVSSQPFRVHLCSETPLFPLAAFSIASLSLPCQVYKYKNKSGSELEEASFAPQLSFAETQLKHDKFAKQSNAYFAPASHICSAEIAFNEHYQSNLENVTGSMAASSWDVAREWISVSTS